MSAIALLCPGTELSLQGKGVGHAPLQALSLHNTDLNLSHIEPTALFRRIMELESSDQSSSFHRPKGLIKRTGILGIEIILD